ELPPRPDSGIHTPRMSGGIARDVNGSKHRPHPFPEGLLWVNWRDPALIRERQLRPSKPTVRPLAQSFPQCHKQHRAVIAREIGLAQLLGGSPAPSDG